MKSLPANLFSLAALPLLLAGGPARADYMNWSYHWGISPGPVLAGGTALAGWWRKARDGGAVPGTA